MDTSGYLYMMVKSMNTSLREISVESVLRPIEQSTGLPNEVYTSEQVFREERDQVLGRGWAGLGFSSDLPKGGYAKPVDFMGLPLLILRGKDNEIRVFHNVCSHRGMILVDEEKAVSGALRCQYHSWAYSFEGELKSTPHLGGVGEQKADGFDHCKHGLKEIRSAIWMDVIFINLSGDAPDFEEYVSPLKAQWLAFLDDREYQQLKAAPLDERGMQLKVATNWKLAIENYCESYHLPWVHPELNRISRIEDHYHIMIGENFGGQGSMAYRLAEESGTTLPVCASWPGDKIQQAEYVAFYPNVLLGIQADHCFVMLVEPLSCNETLEHVRLYFYGEEAVSDQCAASRKTQLESWRSVFAEDVSAVEGMQRGRQSPGYDGGVFSPVMDNPTHHFHQWVARKIHQCAQ